jgi:diaminopimelate decarboxylase
MSTLDLFPSTAQVDEQGQLFLGGCLVSSLAEQYGTPLYIFDEATLRDRCRTYLRALERHYPGKAHAAYASKAGLNLALAKLVAQEGLSLDVVSGGELYVARQAGLDAARIHFHGNNKTPAELATAVDAGVGRVIVDNFLELEQLEALAAARGRRVVIWLRLSPGVDVHTHDYRKTGLLDSKFGLPLETGQAERAVVCALESPHLELTGLHAHIGSQILDTEPFAETVDRLLRFAGAMQVQHGFALREFSPGGGWGVPYTETDARAPIEQYVQTVAHAVVDGCHRYNLPLPELAMEPGRSIAAPAGVALYRVGARKEIPGVRTYVAVDGGMADNIRPALYSARYTAMVANKADRPAEDVVTIAGRFCESGDVLIRDIPLPHLAPGDLLAIPAVGAYCLAMASNYNLVPRPAVLLVGDGKVHLMQRRETYSDLVVRDLPLPG